MSTILILAIIGAIVLFGLLCLILFVGALFPIKGKDLESSGHWEVVPDKENSEEGGFWRVRWSIPSKGKKYYWVGHYGYDGVGTKPSPGWCETAAERHAERLNKKGRIPTDYPAFRSHANDR